MGRPVFHASVEGAQHSPKGLKGFAAFAENAGAHGFQPSNYMLEKPGGGFLSAQEVRQVAEDHGLRVDGVSAHCPFWVHTTAWTGSPTIRPFIPADVAKMSVEQIEQWEEDYILRLLDLCAELKVYVIPMFWGVAYGWEVASGYPWGFWKGPEYDLIKEGDERFLTKTEKIRGAAKSRAIVLAHEIHPGTAAMTADDFLRLQQDVCKDDFMKVNGDPSHCWEGERWEDRFQKVKRLLVATHMKNHYVKSGHPLRCMIPDWPNRPMQFTPLDRGDIDLVRYAELLIEVGYPAWYRADMQLPGDATVPLVVEAEAAFRDLDDVSAAGIRWVNENCCFEVTETSFEDGMGAEKK